MTSCAFADNVRYSYLTQPGQVVTAYSPVTGQYYTMQCAEGFRAYLNNGRRFGRLGAWAATTPWW